MNLEHAFRNPRPETWLFWELPAMEYEEAWDLQGRLVIARKGRLIERDIVLFLEHPPVFTLGRRGGLENLNVSEDFLKKAGIPVVHIERGGDITFHGPGQLVVYPIIDMRKARLSVGDYVNGLEEVMIRASADWGITAGRNPLNRGVWVGDNKLGSIGIAVRRGISFHGFALNVNLSLEPFTWIHPCGLNGVRMTSMARELSKDLPMKQVRDAVKRHMETVFSVRFETADFLELQGCFKQQGTAPKQTSTAAVPYIPAADRN